MNQKKLYAAFSKSSVFDADAAERKSASGGATFRRTLSATQLVMFGIGAVLGAGIFVLTGTAAAQFAGPAVTVSFAIAGAVCALAGLSYAELAAMIPAPGGAYSYTYAAIGEVVAWLVGWAVTLEYTFGGATVAVGWSGYFSGFIKALRASGMRYVSFPHWLSESPVAVTATDHLYLTGTFLNVPAVVIVAVFTYVCYHGISTSSIVNEILVCIKVFVILLFIGIAVKFIHPSFWHPFIPNNLGGSKYGWPGIVRAASLVFFAYIGFDSVSTMAAEVKNPQRDLPIGILGSLIVCTILYIAVAAIVTGIAPYFDLNTPDPISSALAYAARHVGAGNGSGLLVTTNFIVSIGALIGLSTVILATVIAVPRMLYMMAVDGLVPTFLSRIHPTFRVPHISTVMTGVAVALLAGVFPVQLLGDIVSMGTLLAFAAVCAGVVVLRFTQPNAPRAFRVPWAMALCPLGSMACLWLLFEILKEDWPIFVGWLLLGLVIYAVYGYRHSRHHAAA